MLITLQGEYFEVTAKSNLVFSNLSRVFQLRERLLPSRDAWRERHFFVVSMNARSCTECGLGNVISRFFKVSRAPTRARAKANDSP